jgi:hypothetical protein
MKNANIKEYSGGEVSCEEFCSEGSPLGESHPVQKLSEKDCKSGKEVSKPAYNLRVMKNISSENFSA